MSKKELNDAILADVLDELGKVYQSVNELPHTLQKSTEALTVATRNGQEYAKELQKTAASVVAASVETTRAQLVESIAQTAKEVAYHASKKSMLQWAVGCLAVAALCFTGFGYLVFSMGQDAGYQKGMADTVRSEEYQKAACAWSESPEGEMAMGLYELGVLRNLYTCDNPGWVIESRDGGRMCVPKPDTKTKQSWGWQLPSQPKPK